MDLTRTLVLVGLLAVTAALGRYWQTRQGSVRAVAAGDTLSAVDLGAPLGRHATLLQFSSVACAPCSAARRVLGEAARSTWAGRGVAHVELDAADELELVSRLGVLRTPTVFVLDARGQVAHRFSGVPTPAGLATTLSAVTGLPLPGAPTADADLAGVTGPRDVDDVTGTHGPVAVRLPGELAGVERSGR